MALSRRTFIKQLGQSVAALSLLSMNHCKKSSVESLRGKIVTVLGPIEPKELGPTLPHEHILVDFIGAEQVGKHRYDSDEVYRTMLPYLKEIREQGVTGFIECTPMFLGRDPEILVRLAKETDLHILTNTGLYKEPYLPEYAFIQTADDLAKQWIDEILYGIEDTGVHAGFIKIAVHAEDIKPMQEKIVRAACRTHQATGASIACHTAYGPAAIQILDILAEEKTPANSYIFVHANSENEIKYHYEIAERGAWIEYDNIGSWPPERHIVLVQDMIQRGYKNQLLLSMDRGWYHVGEPRGGQILPYTFLFGQFVDEMRKADFDEDTIHLLTVTNPTRAFQIDY